MKLGPGDCDGLPTSRVARVEGNGQVGTHYEKASPNQVRKIYTYATDCNWSDLD